MRHGPATFTNVKVPLQVYPQADQLSKVFIRNTELLGTVRGPEEKPGVVSKAKDQTSGQARGSDTQPGNATNTAKRTRRRINSSQKTTPTKSMGRSENMFASVTPNYSRGHREEFLQQVRWLPAAKRPSVGIRWGLALMLSGGHQAFDEAGVVKYTGPAGRALIDALNDRIRRDDFGDWPDYGDKDAQRIAVLTGDGHARN